MSIEKSLSGRSVGDECCTLFCLLLVSQNTISEQAIMVHCAVELLI